MHYFVQVFYYIQDFWWFSCVFSYYIVKYLTFNDVFAWSAVLEEWAERITRIGLNLLQMFNEIVLFYLLVKWMYMNLMLLTIAAESHFFQSISWDDKVWSQPQMKRWRPLMAVWQIIQHFFLWFWYQLWMRKLVEMCFCLVDPDASMHVYSLVGALALKSVSLSHTQTIFLT